MTLPEHIAILLGRIDERSTATLSHVQKIARQLDEVSTRVTRLESAGLPPVERVVKIALPIVIGLITLVGTESLQQVAKVLSALAGQ